MYHHVYFKAEERKQALSEAEGEHCGVHVIERNVRPTFLGSSLTCSLI